MRLYVDGLGSERLVRSILIRRSLLLLLLLLLLLPLISSGLLRRILILRGRVPLGRVANLRRHATRSRGARA